LTIVVAFLSKIERRIERHHVMIVSSGSRDITTWSYEPGRVWNNPIDEQGQFKCRFVKAKSKKGIDESRSSPGRRMYDLLATLTQ
jgi:hypothetical protein